MISCIVCRAGPRKRLYITNLLVAHRVYDTQVSACVHNQFKSTNFYSQNMRCILSPWLEAAHTSSTSLTSFLDNVCIRSGKHIAHARLLPSSLLCYIPSLGYKSPLFTTV